MAVLLSGSGLRKSFGARVLFEDLSLSLSEGDRTGLIGPNGSGKTTLLEILAGKEAPDAGVRALRKQAQAGLRPPGFAVRAGRHRRFRARGGVGGPAPGGTRRRPARMEMMLGRAGFESLATPAAALSGGWRKRLAIAAALVTSPDVLLLDEPTNHLDLEGILWLEGAIQTANACLVVTHDRYFLENVATQMVEINPVYPQSAFQVKGNYSEFLERREEFLEAQAKQQESLATKVRREVEWLRRGPKARTGKSRARIDAAGRLIEELVGGHGAQPHGHGEDRLHGVRSKDQAADRGRRHREDTGRAQAVSEPEPDAFAGRSSRPGGSEREREDHAAQDPAKATLEPDEGTIRRADRLRIVSFAQDRGAHLDLEISLRRTLCPEGDSVIYRGRPIHVAGWAKRFLFRDEQLEMPVSRLSGGERARVMIARLMLATADVLLLDEPTNDLDIPTLEVLEESLLEFPGALVLVSHDRYLLDRVSTVVIGLDGGEGGVFADYSQWEACARASRLPEKPAAKEPRCRRRRTGPRRSCPTWNSASGTAWKTKILEAEQELAALAHASCRRPRSDAKRLAEAYEKLQEAQRARRGIVRALGGAGSQGVPVSALYYKATGS